MPPLLSLRDLHLQFGSGPAAKPVLRGVSLDIARGESLALVGESGSGKSLTALSLLGLTPPGAQRTQGEIWLHPAPPVAQPALALYSLPERQWRDIRGRRIALVFQEPMTALNPVLRCGEQVAEALRRHLKLDRAAAQARVRELLEEVQLPRAAQLARAYPHELSGGQKQRVLIALALACRPELLIADEPTTALDVTVQRAILRLLERLQVQYGMGLLFITHDLGVVAEVAQRVAVMRQGELVETAEVETLFRAPQHPYTRGLLACRPPLDRRLRRLPTVADFLARDNTDQKDEGEAGNNIPPNPSNTPNSPRTHTIPSTPQPETLLQQLTLPAGQAAQRLERLQAHPPLMRLEGLGKTFRLRGSGRWGKRELLRAVDNVSLELFPGETLGLVGESGSGKTTLGRSLLRLLEPDQGRILYRPAGAEQAVDLRTLAPGALRRLRRELQIVFQDPYSSLNPRLAVGHAIQEPLAVHGVGATRQARRKRVDALLERVGLSSADYHKRPDQFSGGQRQRIGIARALALNPRLVVLDESVSALDVSVQAQVLNLLLELREEMGLTYLFISHDLSVVKLMSDRIAVLQQGRVVELGPAEQVVDQPQQAYTQQLVAAIPQGRPQDRQQARRRREQLAREQAPQPQG